MRLTEEEYARLLKRGPDAVITEAAFQSAIRRIATQYGWMYFHVHNSKHSPEGYPDVTLAKEGCPLIMSELKTMTGQLSKPQEAWLATLAATTGIVTAVWRPDMLQEIIALLRQPGGPHVP